MINKIKRRRAQVFKLHALFKRLGGFELMKDVGSQSIIAEQDIADAGDRYTKAVIKITSHGDM